MSLQALCFVVVVKLKKTEILDECVSCLVADGTASRDGLKRSLISAFRLAL